MKASTERILIRWFHLLASIPILGYIYGPAAQIPQAVFTVRVFLLPAVVLSGLWLWKGHLMKKWWNYKFSHSKVTRKQKPAYLRFTKNNKSDNSMSIKDV